MKKLVLLTAWLVLLGSPNALIAAGVDQAQQLVEQYHLALQSGNTKKILALLGPEEAKHNEHLKEPRYQGILASEFQGSTLEVLHKDKTGIFYVVDYVIHLSPVGTVSERVLVKDMAQIGEPQLKIFKKSPL